MTPSTQFASGFYIGVLAGLIVAGVAVTIALKTAPSLKQERQCVMHLTDRAGHSHAIEGPCTSTGAIS